MTFFKFLLFSILSISFGFESINSIPADCNSFDVSHKIKVEPDNEFEITVSVEGGAKPLQYLFYSDAGKVLSDNLSQNSIQNVIKGKYFCIVRDNKNCRKTIEIEIK